VTVKTRRGSGTSRPATRNHGAADVAAADASATKRGIWVVASVGLAGGAALGLDSLFAPPPGWPARPVEALGAGFLAVGAVGLAWLAARRVDIQAAFGREVATLLSLVAEHGREVIFVRNVASGRLVYCNPAFARMVGIPPDRMPQTRESFLDLVHVDDREAVRDAWATASAGPATVEWRLVRPDGGVREIVTRIVPLRERGGFTRIAGLSEDVTDRRAAADAERRRYGELAHADGRSAVGEVAAALAHEVQQPLFAIRTYARTCLRRVLGGSTTMDEVREVCDRIAAEAERSAQVVQRLGDLVRGRPPQTRRDDLNALVAETVRMAGPDTLPPDVTVKMVPDPTAPFVKVDRVQVQQVLLNLIRNAVEAMADAPRPRRLWVSVAARGPEAAVSVGDSGPGIDPDHAERIFDPFFTTKPDGTGMGLAICRTIVEAHGGRLWAESRDDGGALLTFTLPAAVPPEADD